MTQNIKVKNIILTAVTSLLIISTGINIYQTGNKHAIIDESNSTKLKADSILSVKLLIEKEYNKAIMDLDSYRGKYEEVDQLLANRRNEIITYKNKIDLLQKDNANVKTLRNQLAQLKSMKESFEMQVSALMKTKEDLENELNTSNKQNMVMRQELNDLQRKIELAKDLRAQNISVKWMKVKNGKTKETNRPRRANHLEITFDINNNPFAPVGDKNILVSLYDPRGQLVKNIKSGRNYSFSKPFKYEQKSE
ncbi:MAG: hypothetical protein ACR2GN_03020, partial [Bacteroidia bacterium]